MLSVEAALERVLAATAPIDAERVSIDRAWGRVLAEDVAAPSALPPWDGSAMDGFAVRAADLATATGERPVALAILGTVAAGHPASQSLKAGTTLRIMTGAPVPPGADAVVMKEDVVVEDGRARFRAPAGAGKHVRRRGEDVAAGDIVLEAGTELAAGEIGLAAAVGRTTVLAARRPRVAVVSTGDELVEPGEDLGPGQIFASNAYALSAMIHEAGCVSTSLPIAVDQRSTISARIADGLRADVLLTTGGVSVGEFDYVRDELVGRGVTIDFSQVAMRPGKPITFGRAPGGTLVFGLPGNPASAMVSFELFVRPALRRMLRARRIERPRAEVALASSVALGPRRHFVRARLVREGQRLIAEPLARQGSHELRSMVGIDAILDIPAQGDGVLEALPKEAAVPALLLRAV